MTQSNGQPIELAETDSLEKIVKDATTASFNNGMEAGYNRALLHVSEMLKDEPFDTYALRLKILLMQPK